MSTQAKTFLTPEEYLEIERQAEFKSEYYQGEMFARQPCSLNHNLIAANLLCEVAEQLRHRECDVLGSDMRVRSATGLYTYPDVVVFCGKPQLLDGHNDTLLNPTLLVEVLSPSTEAYDRGRKFNHYRSIESLKEYFLVASDRIAADLYTRQPDDRWLLSSAGSLDDSLDLSSVGCRLNLRELYEKVDFSIA